MIFQPNRLQQKNFAQLKNTSEYAKMVSGFSITPVCLSKYLCQSCQRRNKNQDHRREPKTHFWSILYFKKTIYTFSYFRYGRGRNFPGQFFTTFRYHCIPRHRICNGPIQFTGTEKASGLHYAGAAIQPTGGDSHGHISERNLKESHRKITKIKAGRLPVCRYYGPAQYEKITVCRDTTVEYRREFGFYFTSGNIKAKNTWDETYRSYLVPQYIARSLNLTNNGSDTLSPMFLTYEDIRFDVGTRKIFTLLRAIQLFGPLFDGIDSYDIRAIDTEDPDYTFTFQTRRSAYPERTRISCKGTLIIDRENYYVKNMTFDYIDYQLLRQTLLTNRRKTSSPFSTHAQLTFVYDSCGQNYISSCHQQTTWKYNLGKDFILIEQPSRHQPGINRLIEKEAFHLFGQNKIKTAYQTDPVLVKIHLAQRYPTGKYDSAFFHRLPPLLDSRKAVGDLNHYMQLETQFRMNDGKTYYPDNYILTNKIDKLGQKNYRQNLEKARKELFLLFGDSRKYPCPSIPSP